METETWDWEGTVRSNREPELIVHSQQLSGLGTIEGRAGELNLFSININHHGINQPIRSDPSLYHNRSLTKV